MRIEEAILKLNPNILTLRDNVAYNNRNEIVSYDLAAAQALVQAELYKSQRQKEYPPLADQLDMIFHDGIDAWKAEIQKVKDKYPKPE